MTGNADKSHEVYKRWLELCRPPRRAPDGTRHPYWLLRPVKPTLDTFKV